MRALLLAAGLGTRLHPLTNYLPKCLVPIHGRPLLDYWLETLLDNGVEQVLINTHYMAPMVHHRRYRSCFVSTFLCEEDKPASWRIITY
jgi:NDP-sugar pyrophosphorylase family protein